MRHSCRWWKHLVTGYVDCFAKSLQFGVFEQIVIPCLADEMGKPTSHVQLTLSYDARAISEQDSAKFLGNLKHEIENLSELSLGIFNMGFKKEMLELDQVLNSM